MPSALLVERLAREPLAYATAAIFGAFLGSFANVCILRIPAGKSIVRPGSHCFACGKPVSWYDNLPILSWLILRGRCRRCRASFSARYLFVEVLMAALTLAAYHLCVALIATGEPAPHRLARFAIYTLFLLVLVVLTFIDLDHKKIPDKITYPAIPFFLIMGLLLGDQRPLDLAIGVVVGYGVVRAISDIYFHVTGREGLGYGDGKLLAVVGGLLGWRGVLFALFGGSLLGSVIGVGALLVRRRGKEDGSIRHAELPFGPFLAAAALIFLFLQDQIGLAFRAFIWG